MELSEAPAMEPVKRGFRKTEVGVIPDDWNVVPLDQIAFVTSGKRLPLGNYLVESETEHPYIRVTDMRQGTVDMSEIMYVPNEVFPAIQQYRIYKEDLFISVAGTLGIVGKIPSQLDGANLTENANRITRIQCAQDYLLHVLLSPIVQSTIEGLRTVGAQPKLALGRIRKFDIPMPPTEEEQRAIATALSDVDGLLGSLDALIAKKKAIKQGAMQQLLTGKQRLPGFKGEWEVKTMRQLGNVYGGLTGKSKPDFGEGNARYIPFMNIMNGPVIDTSFLDRVRVGPIESQNKAQKGDLFFNGSSETPEEVGMCSMLHEDIADLYLNSFSFGFRLDKEMKADGMFLSYWFRSPAGRKEIYSSAQGATRYNLAKSNFLRLQVPYPKPEEQTAIATVLSDMDAEIGALEARRSKTALLKQGMMQELLTGRVRLV